MKKNDKDIKWSNKLLGEGTKVFIMRRIIRKGRIINEKE